MKLLSSAIVLSTLAGTALAQPALVSGLVHTPTGGASLGTPQGRRLPVHNLGSSGQDGVEVRLHSTAGGGAGVDVGPLLATSGGEIRIRHKGWDGLIYGNHRVISNGNGTGLFQWNFTNMGATSVNVKVLNGEGVVVSDEDFTGPIVAKEWVPNFTCPNGGVPVLTSRTVRLCNTCPWITVYGWACVGAAGDGGFYTPQGRMIVTPNTGPGSPPVPPIESLIVTSSSLPTFTLSESSIDSLGIPAWGVGQAQLTEHCDDTDGDGTCDERRLSVGGIGSSGQDGVTLDLGTNAGGFELQMSKGNCCRGHVTLMKLYDDGGSEQRVMSTNLDFHPDGSTTEVIEADFSAYGAIGYVITCFDPAGNPLGEPQAIYGGGPRPVWTNRCPPGSIEKWRKEGTPNNPVWVFEGCEGVYHRMTFPNGVEVEGVARFTIEPVGMITPMSSRIRHVVITKNGSEMELKRVIVQPPNHVPSCGTSDFDGDGDVGTDADIEAFFACLGGSCCTTCYEGGSDFNADGDFGTDADIESFFRVLGGGPC